MSEITNLLARIWDTHLGVPNVTSRKAWSEARNVGRGSVNNWLIRKRNRQKILGLAYTDAYVLCIDAPGPDAVTTQIQTVNSGSSEMIKIEPELLPSEAYADPVVLSTQKRKRNLSPVPPVSSSCLKQSKRRKAMVPQAVPKQEILSSPPAIMSPEMTAATSKKKKIITKIVNQGAEKCLTFLPKLSAPEVNNDKLADEVSSSTNQTNTKNCNSLPIPNTSIVKRKRGRPRR
jgi:hypothetical protein